MFIKIVRVILNTIAIMSVLLLSFSIGQKYGTEEGKQEAIKSLTEHTSDLVVPDKGKWTCTEKVKIHYKGWKVTKITAVPYSVTIPEKE